MGEQTRIGNGREPKAPTSRVSITAVQYIEVIRLEGPPVAARIPPAFRISDQDSSFLSFQCLVLVEMIKNVSRLQENDEKPEWFKRGIARSCGTKPITHWRG